MTMPTAAKPALLLAALVAPLLALSACAPGAPKGVEKETLDEAVASAIGDPGTCVLIVEKASAKVVWRYGTHMNCARQLPACWGSDSINTNDLARLAAKGEARTSSCPSLADGSRNVGWASGTAGAPAKGLAYAAMMESGEHALPGREIKTRLETAFSRAGL